jgi:hypothetical protein
MQIATHQGKADTGERIHGEMFQHEQMAVPAADQQQVGGYR